MKQIYFLISLIFSYRIKINDGIICWFPVSCLREDLSHLDSVTSDMFEKQVNEITTYIHNSMIDGCDNIIDQINGGDVFSRFNFAISCFFSKVENSIKENTKKVIIICAKHLINLVEEGVPKNIPLKEIISFWLNSMIPDRNARVEVIFRDRNGNKVDVTKMEFLIEMQKRFGDETAIHDVVLENRIV